MESRHTDKLSYILKDKHPNWKKGQTVLLASGTGTGKTYFVFNDLLDRAIAEDKYLIYICNRQSIKSQIQEKYKKHIEKSNHKAIVLTYQFCENRQMFPDITIHTSKNSESDEEKEIALINEVSTTIHINRCDVLFYVFDEAHYFISDALFNPETNFWIKQKTLRFDESITVFITATPEPLYCFLEESYTTNMNKAFRDMHDKYNKRSEIRKLVEAKYSEQKKIIVDLSNKKKLSDKSKDTDDTEKREEERKKKAEEEKKRKMEFEEELKNSLNEVPPLEVPLQFINDTLNKSPDELNFFTDSDFIYTQNSSYERFNVAYFEEYDELVREIIESNNKWLIFVDKEDDGLYLETILNVLFNTNKSILDRRDRLQDHLSKSAVFLSSKTIKKKNLNISQTIRDINSKNTISPKVLIATSIIDCGVSIEIDNCPELNNIIISQSEKSEFLQMLGRIRFDNDNTRINLYIRNIPPKQINSLRASIEEKLRYLTDFYLLNDITSYYAYKRHINDDPMRERYTLSQQKAIKIISNTINNNRFALLVPKNKSKLSHREKTDDYLSECEISRTAYIHLIYALNQYYSALDKREDNDRTFYLKEQLSWIGKEYDNNCWYSYNRNRKELINYLSEIANKGWFLKEEEKFVEICFSYILDFSTVFLPEQLQKDRSRYESGARKLPQMKKLNSTLAYLDIPFEIESKRFYSPEKATKWRVIKTNTE